MNKDKVAQITIRDLNKLTKQQVRDRIRWIRNKAFDLEKQVEGPWLVTRKQYGRVMNFGLMK